MSVPTPKVNTYRQSLNLAAGGATGTLVFGPTEDGTIPMAGRVRRATVKQTAGDAPSVSGFLRSTASAVGDDQAASWMATIPASVPAAAGVPDWADDNNGWGWAFDVFPTANGGLTVELTSAGGGIVADTYQVTLTIEEGTGEWVDIP